ncbi:MAG TPA: MMPL family transporter [Gemmatimonadaceae bacterium]|nr:MMPL family transporter [Gemmatimonadaceae bacterium]
MTIPGRRAAEVIVRRRWWIVAAWIAIALVLVPQAAQVEDRLDVSARVEGSESARAATTLSTRFPSAFGDYAVLVVAGAPTPSSAAGRATLERIRNAVESLPIVTRSFSWLDAPDTLFIGSNGGTFMMVGLTSAGRRPDDLIPILRRTTSELTADLKSAHPGLQLTWTGESALNYDLRNASAADAEGAERRVLPLTLVLLVLAFGAVAAALVPLLAGGLSIAFALGAAVTLTQFWPLSILLQNVVTMLGLGLGIDYALLVVGRFREGLARGLDAHESACDTVENAGHTIILSGASVAIGFAALLFVPVNEIRSLAVGGLLVIVISVLLAVTLVPALLASLGSRINVGTIRRRVSSGAGSKRWRRWGQFICARPLLVLLVGGLPLVAIGSQAFRLSTDLPRGDWLPPAMESSRALHRLESMKRSGVVQSIRIVVGLPRGGTWDSPAGWAAIKRASDTLAADPRVARVRSLPVVTGLITPNLTLLATVPAEVRGSLGSSDGRLALIDVMPAESATPRDAMNLVREVRAAGGATLTGLPQATMDVGGLPALNVDYDSSISGRFLGIVALVVGLTTLALLIGFRSVLIAAKAVALNLVSVATAFGAVVLVFQDGFGVTLLGLAEPLGGNFPAIPVIVFAVVFGLSMDYEVFLVSRVAEARRAGMSDREAIAEGLARTGGLITSAAAIMIVVFAAFTLGDFVLMKILGFALSVAVLVDATVVRMAIGPALLMLAGKWNWWPGEKPFFVLRGRFRIAEEAGSTASP